MRILKGWTKEEREELEKAKDNGFNNAFDLISGITGFYDRCTVLTGKVLSESADEDNQLIEDILDFYTDKAKFAESKKYYVHFIKNDRSSYLNITLEDGHRVAELGNNLEFSCWQKTKFTCDEVVAIDPRYMAFAVPVEADK